MKHFKKMLAPIIITVLLVLYYLGVVLVLLCIPHIHLVLKLVMIIGPLAVCGVMIGVCISRIKEIQGGEEDDLSKY